MSTTAPKPVTSPIPVQLSEPEFTAFLLPPTSRCPSGARSANWGARRYGLKMYGKAVHTIFQKLTSSYSLPEGLRLVGMFCAIVW